METIISNKNKVESFKQIIKHKKTTHPIESNVPAVNIDENEEEYFLYLAMPGVEPKDFKIVTSAGTLAISALVNLPSHCYQDRCEYRFTEWNRTFQLPVDADAFFSRAIYDKGELMIRIPKGKKNTHQDETIIYVY